MVASITSCMTGNLRDCKLACKQGVKEYGDEYTSCKCFTKDERP